MGRTPGPTPVPPPASVTVTLADARGGPDLEVRFDLDAGLTAADLATAWPDGAEGPLVVDGHVVDGDQSLDRCGLADGATVTVGATRSHAELVVVTGPLAPSSLVLDRSALVGRGRLADLRLDHPSVAPAHALVEPSGDGWTVCAVGGPTALDGRRVDSPQPFAPGAVLSVGAFDLQLVLPERPALVTPPRQAVHRAARPPEVPDPDPGPAPDPPPTTPAPDPPGVLTLLGPVAVGVVLAVTVHPTAGLVTAAMPLLAIGAHLDARRRHHRDGRRARANHAAEVATHVEAVAGHLRRVATRRRADHPTVADALHRARRGVDLWTSRGPDRRLAVGWVDDDIRAPVVVDLGTGAFGIAGPRPWAEAVARALVVQAATRCGPADLAIVSADRLWRWLPHLGTSAPLFVLDGHHPVIEVAEHPARLSDRCTDVLIASADGARLASSGIAVRPFLARADAAERVARVMARWRDPGADGDDLPDEVSLAQLVTPAAGDGRQALACALGVGADGPFTVDLVADGPHALVAGTTGSGKSELLRTWVTALAARHPPSAVAFVLVDYKGGSAFDACADLPHVTGVVTDLDPGLGERLLVGLGAEVRAREALLREQGVGDLRDLTGGPPRLVLVVDEFATLAAELPEFLGALVDVARRGRSLGVHLVLATQRPSGAVSDDIRANTALRIGLRTLDAADSQDVLGGPEAAQLPSDRPGRAWIRRGGEPELVQIATGLRAVRQDEPALTCRVVGDACPAADGPTELQRLVLETSRAWGDRRRPVPTWLPPLAERIEAPSTADGPVVLGRVDRPAQRRQPDLTWEPKAGHLLVLGGKGSGRTSALLNAVIALARRRSPEELHVHVIDAGRGLEVLTELPHVGTVVPARDRMLIDRLLGRLQAAPGPATTLLVVDGYDVLAGAADDLAGVRTLEAVDRLARSGPVLALATARPNRIPPSLAAACAVTVTLRLDDPADYGLVGLRPPGRGIPPGRGWVPDGAEVQLLVPPDPQEAADRWAAPRPGLGPSAVGPLPSCVRLDDLAPAAGRATVGLRDRDLCPAHVRLSPGTPFVITGPPRSGRTSTLDLLLAQLPDAVRAGDGDAFLDRVRTWLADPEPIVFAVDDAERLADPDGVLRDLVNRRHPDAVVLVAVRTDAWCSAYGTWLADLRPCRTGLALGPDPVHDAELWAVALADAGSEPPVGRGVLVDRGRAEVVQVAVP